MKEDRFEEGQWIKHKCYVRRCDLSPDGEFLLYFAARFVGPIYAWTAVCRPPYFTALALWPKTDTWGGGGQMIDRYTIGLNHKPADRQHSNDHPLHPEYKVVPFGEHAGGGEDGYVENTRLHRDGWQLEQPGGVHFNWGSKTKQFVTIDPPAIMSRKNPKHQKSVLHKILTGVSVEQGKHYVERYVLCDRNGNKLRTYETFDWADWDRNGDLLLADDGKIWRLPQELTPEVVADPFSGCRLLIDLSSRTFEATTPPFWATTWQPRKLRTPAFPPGFCLFSLA